MSNDQAYAGLAGLDTPQGEWNRLEFAIRMVQGRQATATLVKVLAVSPGPTDGEPPRVDVQPLVSQVDGAGNGTPHGTIHDLPCFRYQAGGCAVIIDPVVGDIGLAVFAHTDISSVKATRAAALPGSRRRFDWSDGMYLGAMLGAQPTSYVKIGPDGVTVQADAGLPVTVRTTGTVTIDAPTVALTGDLTVQGDIMTGPGSTFNGKSFDSHTHSGVTTGTGTSGPPV